MLIILTWNLENLETLLLLLKLIISIKQAFGEVYTWLKFSAEFFFSFPDSKIFRETTCLRVSWSCLVTSYNCKQGSMETNLQQFSSLLFSNIKKIGHLAILKLLINRGLQHFNSWDQMGLFSWAKIKVRKTIQAKERSKGEIQRV